MTTKTRSRLIAVIVLAIPTLIFLGSVVYNAFRVPPLPPLPTVNGYNDLTNSAAMVAANVSFYGDLNQSNLQVLVASDSAALQLARAGLKKECEVPLDYSPAQTGMLNELASIKRLGQAFAAEARLEEMQGRISDAAKSDLDLIHLGNESARGGVLIQQLVGLALERMGASGLQKLLPQMDAQTSRDSAAALETLDGQRQTWAEVMQQESDWSYRTFPGIKWEIHRIIEYKSIKKLNQKIELQLNQKIVSTRQLIIELAAHAYQLDKGHPVANINDLVPDYLKAIPQDPFTGRNIVYSPQ
jgi:hypothetical protein